MLGPVLRDPWSEYRQNDGSLDPIWFATCVAWPKEHWHNLMQTFRVGTSEGGESYHWRAMDAWVWSDNIVMFSGVWFLSDKHGQPINAFDTVFLSMPNGESDTLRSDLVLLDAVAPDSVAPHWYQYPLSQHVSPLWWRINKDLTWSIKFAKLLVSKTDRQQWEQTGVVEDLKQGLPMFNRLWNALRTTELERIELPEELPLPSWATDANNDN